MTAEGAFQAFSLRIPGVVVRGHRVASGANPRSPFPGGTIAMQLPHFLERGLDLRAMHPATVNVDVAPHRPAVRHPTHTLPDVRWTDMHGSETFSFCRCLLTRDDDPTRYAGWIYYPHPETKPMHEQPDTVLEVLMPQIEHLEYGDAVLLHLDPLEVGIIEP